MRDGSGDDTGLTHCRDSVDAMLLSDGMLLAAI